MLCKNVIKNELEINMMPNILFCKVDMGNIGLCGSIENLTLNIGGKHVNFSCYHHSTHRSLSLECD